MTGTSNINYLSISLPDGQDASSSSISDPLKNPINNKKDFHVHESLSEVPDGFEPPIRELQSHALPLGYGTIIFILYFPEAVCGAAFAASFYYFQESFALFAKL